jgi:hypothetical protein
MEREMRGDERDGCIIPKAYQNITHPMSGEQTF